MEATELESTLENDRILESPFHSTFFFSYRLEIGMLHVVLKHFVGWFPTRVRTLTSSTDSLQEDPCLWWLSYANRLQKGNGSPKPNTCHPRI